VAEVTSTARDRGRAFGIAIALAMSATLIASPVAFGARDPVATGNFKLKLGGAFKAQLRSNGVKMKPKSPKFKSGSLDPVTGAGSLKLKKITFKKGNKKLVYGNVKATLGAFGAKGNIKGNNGKIFSTKGGTVVRNGFGAELSGVKVKFLKGAAKKINRKLELNSLHKGSAGKVSFSEQPKTVEVVSGTAFVDIPIGFLPAAGAIPGTGADPNTVAAKSPAHCISPAVGSAAIAPALKASLTSPNPDVGPLPTGVAARFKFPVTGGTVGPAGNAGVLQLSGGVRLQSGGPDGVWAQGASCTAHAPGEATSQDYLNTTNLAPNLGESNVQSNVFIGGLNPGCFAANTPAGCGILAGDKGIAIGQTIDSSAATVSADPVDRTVVIAGSLIKNNATSTLTLNGLFPNGSGNSAFDFADGDKFGISTLTVAVR
jgi:hypothetical protein